MDFDEPDSTVEVVDLISEPSPPPPTRLQEAQQFLEEQLQLAQNTLATCAYNRDRMYDELCQARTDFSRVSHRLRQISHMRSNTDESTRQLQVAFAAAAAKRDALKEELDRERKRVPPTIAMEFKEIEALQDRVKRMRAMVEYHKSLDQQK